MRDSKQTDVVTGLHHQIRMGIHICESANAYLHAWALPFEDEGEVGVFRGGLVGIGLESA